MSSLSFPIESSLKFLFGFSKRFYNNVHTDDGSMNESETF